MYQVVVFDCDGTLVDMSRMISFVYRGYHKMYPDREHLPYEHFIKCYFMTDSETRKYLHVEENEKQKFYEICFGNADFINDTNAFDGVLEVIKALHERGIRIGINTSRNRETFAMAKQQLGDVYELIDEELIATSDRVKHPKPSPDSLLLIQKNAGCEMREILFIGDSIHDSLCAKNAGCDFGIAKWGVISKERLPCQYVFHYPKEILDVAF